MVNYKCSRYHDMEVDSFECNQCYHKNMWRQFITRAACVRENAERIENAECKK